MKKLALFLLLSVFVFAVSNAQVTKFTNEWTYDDFVWVPCDEVVAYGTFSIQQTLWLDGDGWIKKIQSKVKGEFVAGDDVYVLKEMVNDMWWGDPDGQGANPNTYVVKVQWHRNGMLIGIQHLTFHYTINANGELTSYVVNEKWECK